MEKDYAKEANQLHIIFHQSFIDVKEKDAKVIEGAHALFDTLVLWIEQMQKEIYRLQGEARIKGVCRDKRDFQMFKRLHFQVRDEALTEEAYLPFLAGYFSVIPTPEDLKIPEKDAFKIRR